MLPRPAAIRRKLRLPKPIWGGQETSCASPSPTRWDPSLSSTMSGDSIMCSAATARIRYPIAIGTPDEIWTGRTFVQSKVKDPVWKPPWNPDEVVPGGPGNPLGERAIYLDWSLYESTAPMRPAPSAGQPRTVVSACTIITLRISTSASTSARPSTSSMMPTIRPHLAERTSRLTKNGDDTVTLLLCRKNRDWVIRSLHLRP